MLHNLEIPPEYIYIPLFQCINTWLLWSSLQVTSSLAHGLIQRVIHSSSLIEVKLEEKLLDLHPYPNASALPAKIHWFLLDNYIIDLTTLGIKKAEDTICITFTYIYIHMPGQKIQQKRANGSVLCSFGVSFFFYYYFFFLFQASVLLKNFPSCPCAPDLLPLNHD